MDHAHRPAAGGELVRLDLTQLRVFHEAARLGGFTAAARRLHVTQSAVSHAVAKLEATVGCELVVFRSRRLGLTDEGEVLRKACERVFADLEEVEGLLESGGKGMPRRLRVGAPAEFGATVLLRKIRPLLEAHPELHLDFHLSNELLDPLLREELDLAVDCRVHLHPELERVELFREKYSVVASPAFLAAHPIRRPADLGAQPLLSLDKDGAWWGRLLGALPEAKRPKPRRIVEIDHLRGLINAAEEGLGVGLAPTYSVLKELDQGILRVLFPRLKLLEDRFFVYQLRSHARREGNRHLTAYLASLDASEFGDSIGPIR